MILRYYVREDGAHHSFSMDLRKNSLGMGLNMLIASYYVGRDKKGEAVSITVAGVLLDGYRANGSELDFRNNRVDLINTFKSDEDDDDDGFILPDLPSDIVNLLERGESIVVLDIRAEQCFHCKLQEENKDHAVSGSR